MQILKGSDISKDIARFHATIDFKDIMSDYSMVRNQFQIRVTSNICIRKLIGNISRKMKDSLAESIHGV